MSTYLERTLSCHQLLGIDNLDDPILKLGRLHGGQIKACHPDVAYSSSARQT